MNEVGEKYLPLGSVVLLKGALKKVMITGYACVSSETGDKVYDYSGCMYPEGFLNYNEVCVFDHDKIEKVFYKGYHDEDAIKFHNMLNNHKE